MQVRRNVNTFAGYPFLLKFRSQLSGLFQEIETTFRTHPVYSFKEVK